MSYFIRVFNAIKDAALSDIDESYGMKQEPEETPEKNINEQLKNISDQITELNNSLAKLSKRVGRMEANIYGPDSVIATRPMFCSR